MARLVMMVGSDRKACGRGLLVTGDGRKLFGPFRVLATASRWYARRHGNPTCSPTLPFGHPPAGTYLLAGCLPPGFAPRPRRARRFGRVGALLLTPKGGDALAAVAKGRRYLYLHGGPLDRRGRLRPTLGGLRVSDADFTKLVEAMNSTNAAGDPLSELEIVHTPAALVSPRSPLDLPGRRGWLADGRSARARTPTPRRRVSVSGAAFLSLAACMRLPRAGAPPVDPARRDFLALALLVAGSASMIACGGDDERPSPCHPVKCDPAEPYCPPTGYVCPDDVTSGGGVAGGGDVVVGGGVVDVPPSGGADSSSDDSGGGG